MPEKFSIMDILQTHFLQNKNRNKLFFKVDMGDLRVTCNDDGAYDERENSPAKYSMAKSLSLTSRPRKNSQDFLSSKQHV